MRKLLFIDDDGCTLAPSAEALARVRLMRSGATDRVSVASGGAKVKKAGAAPGGVWQQWVQRAGGNMATFKARQVTKKDLSKYDGLIALSAGAAAWLQRKCPEALKARIVVKALAGATPAAQLEALDAWLPSVLGL